VANLSDSVCKRSGCDGGTLKMDIEAIMRTAGSIVSLLAGGGSRCWPASPANTCTALKNVTSTSRSSPAFFRTAVMPAFIISKRWRKASGISRQDRRCVPDTDDAFYSSPSQCTVRKPVEARRPDHSHGRAKRAFKGIWKFDVSRRSTDPEVGVREDHGLEPETKVGP